MLVYKEKLPDDIFMLKCVELPYDNVEAARKAVLHVELQHDEPCMWYDAKKPDMPKTKYLVFSLGTGQYSGILDPNWYIGTVLMDNDSFVLHYFLIDLDEFDKITPVIS